MIEEGEPLEPRDLFYYGRELFYHKQYEYAICVLKKFLKEPDAGLKTDWTVVWFSPIVIRHQAMTSMLLRYCFTVSCQIFQEPKYAVRLGKYFL